MTQTLDSQSVRAAVREAYGEIAAANRREPSPSAAAQGGCCAPGCCGGSGEASLKIGYSAEDLAAVPDGADMGLGCGNPQSIASLKSGERVLDLGAGGGFDAFLAARQVGPEGFVIGVDMTPQMVERARENAVRAGLPNVEFRLGEIENLPVADGSVDVIMSNCVINLSPAKEQVFHEAFRVLRPGGRLAISDVVAVAPMPREIADSVAALTGCIAGAAEVADIEAMLEASGFTDIRITINERAAAAVRDWLPGSGAETFVASAMIEATKGS